MSKGWKLKDENWNAKSNHVHELNKRRHAGSWVSLIPCKISTDQLWPPAMTPTYWVCHPGASCRYVFTTWGECLRWHKTHQRFLCPLLCLKMKNIREVRTKTAKVSAKDWKESQKVENSLVQSWTHTERHVAVHVLWFMLDKGTKLQTNYCNPCSICSTVAARLTARN